MVFTVLSFYLIIKNVTYMYIAARFMPPPPCCFCYYKKSIFLSTIPLTHACILFILPTHSIAFSTFNCSVTPCLSAYSFTSRENISSRLLVNISKIAVQSTTCKQRGVNCPFLLLQIAFVTLPPNTNNFVFFFGW